jgi:hypothetical protein
VVSRGCVEDDAVVVLRDMRDGRAEEGLADQVRCQPVNKRRYGDPKTPGIYSREFPGCPGSLCGSPEGRIKDRAAGGLQAPKEFPPAALVKLNQDFYNLGRGIREASSV